MKALRQQRYGAPTKVLRLVEVEPPAPGAGEVVVRVSAAALNPADWHAVRGEPLLARASLGLTRPKDRVPGADFAGTIVDVGRDVDSVQPGDRVLGTSFGAGLGAFADLVCVPAGRVVPWPDEVSAAHAAALGLAGTTALQAVRTHGGVEAGHRVLVIGASGGVGTLAVQLAARLDAEVVGVASSRNLDLVRDLGAHDVIDHTRQSLRDVPRSSFDVVVQLAGAAGPGELRRLLTRGGVALMLGGDGGGRVLGPMGTLARASMLSALVPETIRPFTVAPNRADLTELAALAAAGELRVVGDREVELSEVPAEIERMQLGHTRGRVVVRPGLG